MNKEQAYALICDLAEADPLKRDPLLIPSELVVYQFVYKYDGAVMDGGDIDIGIQSEKNEYKSGVSHHTRLGNLEKRGLVERYKRPHDPKRDPSLPKPRGWCWRLINGAMPTALTASKSPPKREKAEPPRRPPIDVLKNGVAAMRDLVRTRIPGSYGADITECTDYLEALAVFASKTSRR